MLRLLIIYITFAFLFACQQTEQVEKIEDNSKVLAQVGDKKITEQYLQAVFMAEGIQDPSVEQKAKRLDQLLTQAALANQFEKDKLAINAKQRYILDYLKLKTQAELSIENFMQIKPVTEQELSDEYNRVVKEAGQNQYLVHHLLYADELEAVRVLDAIDSVESYLEKQKDHLSQLDGHASNVGQLGWVSLPQLPKKFRKILPTMTPGSIHKEVVNSQFGAHIIYLEDVRPMETPSFEASKEGLKKTLEKRKLDKYLQLLKIKADIKLFDHSG